MLRARRAAALAARREQADVTLDVFLPFSKVDEFLGWYEREFGYFPLWCVPYRRVRDYEWLDRQFYAGLDDELFLDLAIYGMAQPGGRNYHRVMEDEAPRARRDQDADLAQLLLARRVLVDLEQARTTTRSRRSPTRTTCFATSTRRPAGRRWASTSDATREVRRSSPTTTSEGLVLAAADQGIVAVALGTCVQALAITLLGLLLIPGLVLLLMLLVFAHGAEMCNRCARSVPPR